MWLILGIDPLYTSLSTDLPRILHYNGQIISPNSSRRFDLFSDLLTTTRFMNGQPKNLFFFFSGLSLICAKNLSNTSHILPDSVSYEISYSGVPYLTKLEQRTLRTTPRTRAPR